MDNDAIKKRIATLVEEVKSYQQEAATLQQRLQELPALVVGNNARIDELKRIIKEG